MEGEEELVIKALDDQTMATDLVSGASILGDGRVVLIMNLAAVMERFAKAGTDRQRSHSGLLLSHADGQRLNALPAEVRAMSAQPVRVLVVDDSALMRKLIPQMIAGRQLDSGRRHGHGWQLRTEKDRRAQTASDHAGLGDARHGRPGHAASRSCGATVCR